MEVELSKEATRKLEELSRKCRIPVKKLVELILEEYVRTGGKTHYGTWEHGSRIVIAWPNRAGYSIVRVEG